MIGDNPHQKSGQVLLIVVLLLVTVVTVVMTVSFNSTAILQTTKLSEDSQNALAAAEAGIEAAIKQPVGSSISLSEIDQFSDMGITGQTTVSATAKPHFVTMLLQKDEQYTFYLADYPGYDNPYAEDLDIFFVSESGGCPAIGVTVVTMTNDLQHYGYNSCEEILGDPMSTIQKDNTLENTLFTWEISTPLALSNSKFMLIKVFNGPTKIGLQSNNKVTLLSLQGKQIDSEAQTQNGITKRVHLFQTHPQLITSFFETECIGPGITASQYYDYVRMRKESTVISNINEILADGIYVSTNDITITNENEGVFSGKKVVLLTDHKNITIEDNFSPSNSSVGLVSDTFTISEGVTTIRAILLSDSSIDPQFVTCNIDTYNDLLPYLSTNRYERKQI